MSDLSTAAPQMQERLLPALISVPYAAKFLGISRASAYRYAASGELPVQRLGGRVYVVTARLLAMIDRSAA